MHQKSQAETSSGSIGGPSLGPFFYLFVRGLTRYAWVPIPLLIGGIVILWMIGDPAVVREPPYLLLVLNITFRTAIGIFIASLAARSFSRNGSLPILALGSGMLFFGLGSAVGAAGIHFGQLNLGLTVTNTGFWFSGACHLFAAFGTLSHGG